MTSPESDAPEMWIVDYDIPQNPASRRRQFYRRRQRVCAAQHGHIAYSTNSVLLCRTKALAVAVHDLANEYGKSHLYRVIEEPSPA